MIKINLPSILWPLALMLLFVFARLPGISLPYHQDEWKSAAVAIDNVTLAGHPPLTEWSYRLAGWLWGGEYLRFWPLGLGLLGALLLFVIVRRRLDRRAADWALFLSAVSFYGIWASLMFDTDGALLPFLFLLSVYLYDRWRLAEVYHWRWLMLLALATMTGLLVKLSFVLPAGALFLDWLWSHYHRLSRRQLLGVVLGTTGVGVIALLAVMWSDAVRGHVLYYVVWSGRNYLQIAVQTLKALFYLSPLLVMPLFWVSRAMFKPLRPFFIYLGLGAVFYFLLFDFSRGALDKYLMFAIFPLLAISGAVLAEVWPEGWYRRAGWLILALLASAFLLGLNFLPHETLSLYPKSEWFTRVVGGRWQMLNPFTGGSGPLGFYVSFLFIAAAFAVAFLAAVVGWRKKEWRPRLILILLLLGLVYNGVFAEELFWGRFNGHPPEVLKEALVYIEATSTIQSVLTYNDIGAYELSRLGKYAGRFYAAPQFEEEHRKRFAGHNQAGGYYLVVEMPLLYDGFYKEFFSACRKIFETQSGAVPGGVYACQSKP